ncbi:MAG: ATP synthase F1 subunit delta [Candidatus Zixiibacteriota bacterium]
MLAQQIAKKYSRAIFELAKERNQIDLAWEQFKSFGEYLKIDDTFVNFMTAPQVNDTNKMALIKNVFEGRLETPFYNFIKVLVHKRRIKYLEAIIEHLDILIREHKKLARVTCFTISKISDEERRKLIKQLEQKTSLTVELIEKVDAKMIGGMKVMLDNQIIDGSVRHDLNQLRNRLMKVKVH